MAAAKEDGDGAAAESEDPLLMLPLPPSFDFTYNWEARLPEPDELGAWQSVVDGREGGFGVRGAVSRAASLRSDLQSLLGRSETVLREEKRLGQPSSDYGHQVAALSKALALHEGAWGCLQQYLQCRHALSLIHI